MLRCRIKMSTTEPKKSLSEQVLEARAGEPSELENTDHARLNEGPPPPPSKLERKKHSAAPPPPRSRSGAPTSGPASGVSRPASVPPAPLPPPRSVSVKPPSRAPSLRPPPVRADEVVGEPPTIVLEAVAKVESAIEHYVAAPPVAEPSAPGAAAETPAAEFPSEPSAVNAENALKGHTDEPVPPSQGQPLAAEAAAPVPGPMTPAAPPVPLSATTDSLLLISGAGDLPTRFDLEASERHGASRNAEDQMKALLENAQQLRDLFVAELSKKGDKSRTARLHYELARVLENPIGELEGAAKHFEQAHRLAPNHIPSVRGARRVLLSLKRYQQAVKLFDAEADAVADVEQKALLLYHKGLVLDAHLGQRAEAREALEKASELGPRNLTILKATALLEEQAGAWEPLLKSFERCAAALAEQPKERAVYLSQMARVCAVRLRDLPRAIELYKAAFEADPLAPGALPALKEHLYQLGRFRELVGVLEREAELARSPEACAFAKFRVARIWVERLFDLERGIAALEHGCSLLPTDRTVLHELVRLYELSDRPAELASASERLLSLSPATTPEPLVRLGQLYEERLSQPERAIELYGQALSIQSDFRPALLALGRLRALRGEWSELIVMLSREGEASSDAEQRAALQVRIAGIYEQHLNNQELAMSCYRKALELRPGHEPAYKALVRLLSGARKWRELIEVYERGIESAPSTEEKITRLFQIGRLQEDALGQPAAAVGTYRRILDLDANSLEAIHALQRAAELGEKHEDLIFALELEASKTAERARQLNLRHQVAGVLETQLLDPEAALEKLQALLDVDPTYAPAITSLARIYFAERRFEELVSTFKQELGITRSAAARASLLCQMAEICEKHLGQPEEAANNYKKAVQTEPRHLLAVQALRRVCTRQGDFKEVARLLESEVQLLDTTPEKVRTWFLLGEVYENRLDAQEKALEAYGRALELAPDFRPAADGCLRLLEQGHNYKGLKERLVKEAAAATEPLYQISANYVAGEVSRDHLKQLHEASVTFEALLGQAPEYSGALLALERLYFQLGNKEGLLSLYATESEVLQGVASGVAAHKSRVHLLETQVPTNTEALKSAQLAVLRLLPGDVDALHGLERLALLERDPALLGQIDARLGVAKLDRHSVSAHQTRLAEAMDARGDDAALQVYRSALAHDPENLSAARGVSRVAERMGRPELLAEAAEYEATLLKQPSEAARLLTRAAGKLRSEGQKPAAIQQLSRALEVDPDSASATELLIELETEAGGADHLIGALSRAAASAQSAERRAQLWNQVARLQSESKGDAGAAVAAASRATKEQPGNVEAHVLLAELYASSKKWIECTAEYQEVLKLHPTDEVRFVALLRLARIQHEHLARTPLAASNAGAALELQPENREALELLLLLQCAREELNAALDTARRLVAASSVPKQRAEALHQLAKLEHSRKDDLAASEAYAGAVAIVGTQGSVCAEYRAFVELCQSKPKPLVTFSRYAAALREFLGQTALEASATLPARLELGRTLCDQLGEPALGLVELRGALASSPHDLSLRAEVAQRVAAVGENEEAINLYRELLRQAPHAVQHWRALSKVYDALKRSEQARLCLAPLVAIHDATPPEHERYASVAAQPGALKARAFEAPILRALEEGAAVTGPALDLLQSIAQALPKLYPVPFESYGVTRNDKLTSRMTHPIRQVADRVATLFGVEEFELYLHAGPGDGISVEMSEHTALFVSKSFASLPAAEQVFLLARVMANVARGLSLVDKLPRRELQALLACTARTHDPGFGSEFGDSATLDAQAKRISKAMPWFSGSRLEPAARSFASAKPDTALWVRNVRLSAARAAALAADELAICLSTLTREGCDDAFMEQLTGFVSSDAGLALKRQLCA